MLAGIPNIAKTANISPPPVSAANPWYGLNLVTLTPSVLMTFYPPKNVPRPIAPAAANITQSGI